MNTERVLSSPSHSAALQGHRRQAFWQILLPLILAGGIVVAVTIFLIVMSSTPGTMQDTRWANISLIWLLIPSIAVSLIWLALLAGLIFLMVKALSGLLDIGRKTQYYAFRTSQIARNISDKITSPVIGVKSVWAGWQKLENQVRGFFKR